MYVTDFAALVDDGSKNFHFVKSVQKISAVAAFICVLGAIVEFCFNNRPK